MIKIQLMTHLQILNIITFFFLLDFCTFNRTPQLQSELQIEFLIERIFLISNFEKTQNVLELKYIDLPDQKL